jgi:DNA phosphorothioation-dependent restriction protein DptG
MNVLDKLLNKAIEKTFNKNINESIDGKKYKKISTVLDEVIKQDFEFLVSSKSISSDDLKLFLEYYMFMYMTQSILILQNKQIGKRSEMLKLYFCLSWEEVSKTRLCYEHGYRSIDAALNALYPNITKCQFLNSTDCPDEQYDFIDFYEHFDEFDNEPSKKELIDIILWLKEKSQTYIFDEIDDQCEDKLLNMNFSELINLLYEMIDRSFYKNSSRSEANIKFKNNYSKMFSNMGFLKSHGSLGYIYSINEKTLLFFLKVIMKDKEIMNLNEFILELEKRGIYMDEKSHDLIANYFDKLNLLEKKSDSGDAKYVKKLL